MGLWGWHGHGVHTTPHAIHACRPLPLISKPPLEPLAQLTTPGLPPQPYGTGATSTVPQHSGVSTGVRWSPACRPAAACRCPSLVRCLEAVRNCAAIARAFVTLAGFSYNLVCHRAEAEKCGEGAGDCRMCSCRRLQGSELTKGIDLPLPVFKQGSTACVSTRLNAEGSLRSPPGWSIEYRHVGTSASPRDAVAYALTGP